MKTLYMLCGVPASGKSTWIKKLQREEFAKAEAEEELLPDEADFWQKIEIWTRYSAYDVSTDKIIEAIAKDYRRKYDDCFNLLIKFAEDQMHRELESLIKTGATIIVWDQTNLTPEVRAKKLDRIPADFRRVAVNFVTPPMDVLEARLASRPGKNIPKNVIESMIARYVPATLAEDFNEVITVDTTREIKDADD